MPIIHYTSSSFSDLDLNSRMTLILDLNIDILNLYLRSNNQVSS